MSDPEVELADGTYRVPREQLADIRDNLADDEYDAVVVLMSKPGDIMIRMCVGRLDRLFSISKKFSDLIREEIKKQESETETTEEAHE